jgi:hypothetical protein
LMELLNSVIEVSRCDSALTAPQIYEDPINVATRAIFLAFFSIFHTLTFEQNS